ncbi:MAG TPA: Ig-like domain-containing protein [Gemmatimonadales bacterium]|nr:Ig-like domain-containing protein [Gemmatimonadales bacterium]
MPLANGSLAVRSTSLVAAALVAGCAEGSDVGTGPETGIPALVAIVAGNGQSGTAGQTLAGPIVARVTDEAGRPVPEALVVFAPGAGAASPAASRTDARGEAPTVWTLGTAAGPSTATATVAGVTPAVISATILPGPATALAFAESPVGAVAGIPLDPAVRVVVADAYGNLAPASASEVVLSVNRGALAGPTTIPAVDGVAVFSGLTIGLTGHGYVLAAESDGLAGAESAPFDVVSGVAVRLELGGGDGQTATAGTRVPVRPTVVALDGSGNGVAGIGVELTVLAGGGTVTPVRLTTGADGTASPDEWVLGPAPGPNTLRASFAALPGESVEFLATATPGVADPARSTVSADPTFMLSGETAVIRVVARDAIGNAVPGATVRLTASGPGNTVVQPPPTDAAGLAEGTLRAVGAGTRTVSVDVDGVVLSQTAAVAVVEVGSVSVSPGTAAPLVGQTVAFTATVLDGEGAPLEDAVVEWTSSKPGVAGVDAAGVVTALKPGTAAITARSGGHGATAQVSVSYGEGVVTGLRYCTMEGEVERMDVYLPSASFPRPLPVAVHVHGGGWVSGHRTRGTWFAEIRDRLVGLGYIVVSVDYRLAPEYRYPAQIQDTKCAIRHLRTKAAVYGLDPDRIGAWGTSAGGQLVGLLGTTDPTAGFDDAGEFPGASSRVQAAVALSPITDFTAPDELRDDYSRVFLTWPQPDSPEMIQASPVTHVTPDDTPFLFVVGEADTLVLPAQSARMDGLLRGTGVPSSLVTVRHADHGLNPTTEPISPSKDEVITKIAEFLDRYLR